MYSVALSGSGPEQIAVLKDHAAGSEVRIAVGRGANAYSFLVNVGGRRFDVLYAEEGFPRADLRATASGIPILAPFPNRLAGGTFVHRGQRYTMPCNERGGANAIHGFVFDQPFRVKKVDSGDCAIVEMEFQLSEDRSDYLEYWPTDFVLRVSYQLNARHLIMVATISNPSSEPLPFGFGTHPYFRLPADPTQDLDQCSIVLPACLHVELDKCLPTGVVRPVTPKHDLRDGAALAERVLDDVYTGLEFEHEMVHYYLSDEGANLRIVQGHQPNFPYAVAYIPPHRKAVCVEPYTCVTNAANLGERIGANGPPTGWMETPPGETRQFLVAISAGENV